MKTLSELDNLDLRWVQPKASKREYELQNSDGEMVARLRRTSSWSYKAEVEAVGNRFLFDRKGFWQNRFEVTSAGTGQVIATVKQGFSKNTLTFNDGETFYWRQGNFWGTRWVWTSGVGDPILGFEQSGFLKLGGSLNIDPEYAKEQRALLLILLGWYLIVVANEDSAATTVVFAG